MECQVSTFRDVIKSLQNMGEVNFKISCHAIDKQDAGSLLFRSEKKVVFVLDPPKPSKKQKAWCCFGFPRGKMGGNGRRHPVLQPLGRSFACQSCARHRM